MKQQWINLNSVEGKLFFNKHSGKLNDKNSNKFLIHIGSNDLQRDAQ